MSGRTAFTCRPGSRTRNNAILALIGATPEGKKELLGFTDCIHLSNWGADFSCLHRSGLGNTNDAPKTTKHSSSMASYLA